MSFGEKGEYYENKISPSFAKRVAHLAKAPMPNGIGEPGRGQMCVQHVVCYAMGIENEDTPQCVGAFMIDLGINLNDSGWSSPEARSEGLRRFAMAELGSNRVSDDETKKLFRKKLLNSDFFPRFIRLRGEAFKSQYDKYLKLAARFKNARSHAAKISMLRKADFDAALTVMGESVHYDGLIGMIVSNINTIGKAECRDQLLQIVADIGVDTMIELKSEGSEYIHLVE